MKIDSNNIRTQTDDVWGTVTYVNMKQTISKTTLPPFGHWWDRKMELSYKLMGIGNSVSNVYGVEKFRKRGK